MPSLANRLHGFATIAFNLRGQKETPYQSRQILSKLRDANIRRQVTYAARYVPYYRELFRAEGIHPREIQGAKELDQLPLTCRDQVKAQPELFQAEAPSSRKAVSFRTSGTTGIPLEVWHDRRSLLLNIAYGEREREPLIRICGGGFRPSEVYVGYETSTFKKVIQFYEANTLLPVRPRRRFIPLSTPIEEVVSVINEEKPDILTGYGGWIDLLFRTAASSNVELHRPKLVMFMGEAIPNQGAAFIEEQFQTPVLSRYNAVEAFKIGYYCEERTGFHIHEDLCHVRIVRPDGSNAEPEEEGRVIISNLLNRATVLLNYPIGDVAALLDHPCRCGRSFKLLSPIQGRVEDMLTASDGRAVHPRMVWEILKQDRRILQYQLIQRSRAQYELHLVMPDETEGPERAEKHQVAISALLGPEAKVDLVSRSQSLRGSGGKYRAVISEYQRKD